MLVLQRKEILVVIVFILGLFMTVLPKAYATPDIEIWPASGADFGVFTVESGSGPSGTRKIWIKNNGTSDLKINSISSPSDPFSLDSTTTVPFTVTAGAEKDINIQFNPKSQGNYSSTITISSDDPDESNLTVTLTGTTNEDATTIKLGNFITGEIKPVGDSDAFYFYAKAGDAVSITTSIQKGYTDGFTPEWELYAPDGTLLKSATRATASVVLPSTGTATGTYSILIRDGYDSGYGFGEEADQDTGRYGFSVQGVSELLASGEYVTSGQNITDEIEAAGDTDVFYFDATQGNTVSITTGIQKGYADGFTPEWKLYAPDGTLLKSATRATASVVLPSTGTATGTYSILIRDGYDSGYGFGEEADQDSGRYGFSFQCLGCTTSKTPTPTPTPTPTTSSDVTAPSGSVSINSGASYTPSTTVTLNFSATDSVGVTGYYISTSSAKPSASISGWTDISAVTSYSANISYTLSSGDGSKTVYVWYKDAAGNVSNTASDSITLDTTVPTVTISSPTSNSTYTPTSSTISLGGSASDSVSGISSVTWSNNKGGNGTAAGTDSWTASSISLSSGDNVITVTAKDGAGNSGTDTITVTYSSVTVPTPSPSPTPSETEFTNIKTINKSVNGFDIGDVDNDGTNELVVSVPSDKQVLVYDTQYKLKYTISFNESPNVILISDLDDDGKNELIIGTTTGDSPGYVYVGIVDRNGNFSTEWKSPQYYLRMATEFAVGDLDSDSKKELVIGLSYWNRKLVSYEYTGSTYTKIFEDNIGSDVDSVFVADNRLFVGTRCWSDYGLRVYKQYSLEFSDTGDGITNVCAGDVNGDGVVEIIRGIGTQCGGSSSPRPSFSIYDTNYSKIFTSSEISKNNDVIVYVATGELISGNGEEIAIGSWSNTTQSYPENIRIFQYNGSTYEEIWKKELSDLVEDVYYLKIADLNGDGQNELFVSTTYNLMVYAPGTGTTTSTPTPSPSPAASPTPGKSPTPVASPTPQVSPSPANEGVVFGFVNDQDEQPMKGVTITITGKDSSDSTETDENGYYEFGGLSKGNYTLTYKKEGFLAQTQDISLKEGEVKDLGTVTMEQVVSGKIYGNVVDIKGNPLEFVRLRLKGVKTKVIKTASSDADGFFEFTDLEADSYVIIAKKKKYRNAQQKVKLEEGESTEIEIEMKKTSKRVKELSIEGIK